jgi:hypothetical protein
MLLRLVSDGSLKIAWHLRDARAGVRQAMFRPHELTAEYLSVAPDRLCERCNIVIPICVYHVTGAVSSLR